jgi:hypothetical protein
LNVFGSKRKRIRVITKLPNSEQSYKGKVKKEPKQDNQQSGKTIYSLIEENLSSTNKVGLDEKGISPHQWNRQQVRIIQCIIEPFVFVARLF